MIESFVAFDLETTGVSPERDGIIQLAAARVEGGRIVAAWDTLVDPGLPVPAPVQRLTGIGSEDLVGQPRPVEAVRRFLAFAGGLPLVAHNASFDVGFLERVEGGQEVRVRPVYCSLELARIALPGAGSYRLADLARHLGLGPARFHDARADAAAVAHLFLHLLERLRWMDGAALSLALRFLGDDPFLAPVLVRAAGVAGGRRHSGRGERAHPLPRPGPGFAPGGAGRQDAGTEGAGEDASPGARGLSAAEGAPSPDPDGVTSFFAAGGPVAARLGGYEERPGQVEMARAVARCLGEGGFLLVEAGTGTGKSLAYLVPAALRALASGQRVVVATHTIALQEQLWHKDLPLLQSVLPRPVRAALLKGRANYLCLLKWRQVASSARLPQGEAARRFYARLAVWLAETETGDRTELALRRQEEPLWLTVAADAGCTGPACPLAGSCFFLASRARAERAELLLVNHALLLADAAAGRGLLPEYSHLVCDEAHHLAEEAVRQLGHALSSAEVEALLWPLLAAEEAGGAAGRQGRRQDGREAAAEAARAAREAARQLFRAARQACPARAGAGEGGEAGAWRIPPGPGLEAVRAAALALAETLDGAARAAADLAEAAEDDDGGARAQALALAGAARVLRDEAEAAGLEEWATWAEATPDGEVTLRVSPLWPGQLLAERLLAGLEAGVFTSATLTVAGSFEASLADLGLDGLVASGDGRGGACRCLRVPSSFNYREQALLALPTDLPEPQATRDEAFTAAAAAFLAELAAVARGGCLFLFTSHEMLRQVYWRVRDGLLAAGLLPLAQGVDGSRHRLAEALRENGDAVLFGTASFWEGIDVPGDNLRCVAIVRLPFRSPGDPLHEARLEALARRGEDGFRRLTLPAAVLRFRQGFGRLIRRATDRGAVVVLDPRLLARWDSYGRCFVESLPGPRLVVGRSAEVLGAVARWLGGEGEGATAGLPAERGGEVAAC